MRIEEDSMGEVEVPEGSLYAAQTQRAVNNFRVSGIPLPRAFIRALGYIKQACARANGKLSLLDTGKVLAIADACALVINGEVDKHFPVDVFQTGSGTSSNMNANEVIANIASSHSGLDIHPNNHVNMSQSSNDVIPTAIHVSACLEISHSLLPDLDELSASLEMKSKEAQGVVKTGRTHLMDAMPVTLEQEILAWRQQIEYAKERMESVMVRLGQLAIGGTAVGTGVNCSEHFSAHVCHFLRKDTGIEFSPKPNKFEGLSVQDAAVEASGQLKTLAVSLMKIVNDLRWMNSGPLSGLGEITLPVLQPGSSIMPGKVNPVIPEAVAMVCAQVMGNDTTIAVAGQSGNFQLNVMLPVIAYNLLQSIELLANALRALAQKAIAGFTIHPENMRKALTSNPILVTALNRKIGYEKGAAIAKRAYRGRRQILEVVLEDTELSEEEAKKLLDPLALTKGGIV